MPATAEEIAPPAFDTAAFERLFRDPESEITGAFGTFPFAARVAIPRYGERVAHHYRGQAPGGLRAACNTAEIPFALPQFGLVVRFRVAAEIPLHGADMVLEGSIRALVGRFGPVIFRNATIAGAARTQFHRNIFPHLRFHIDRGPMVPNQYSCFTRDPFDDEQKLPRESSTVFVANIVACLQLIAEGGCDPATERGVRASYDLFDGVAMAGVLDRIVLEQPWHEPAGTGEIVVLDNRTVLHATYHKDGETKGYPIGARYLI